MLVVVVRVEAGVEVEVEAGVESVVVRLVVVKVLLRSEDQSTMHTTNP